MGCGFQIKNVKLKMKKLILLFFVLFLSFKNFAQNKTTTEVLKEINVIKWKADSLGLNDYRQAFYYPFVKSKIDTITRKFLVSILGEPYSKEILSFGNPGNKRFIYSYVMYNKPDFDKRKKLNAPYIKFVLDMEEEYLMKIEEGGAFE